jgi:hypothetical protein
VTLPSSSIVNVTGDSANRARKSTGVPLLSEVSMRDLVFVVVLLSACSTAPPDGDPMLVAPLVDAAAVVDLGEGRDLEADMARAVVVDMAEVVDLIRPGDMAAPPDLLGFVDYFRCIGERCDSLACKWDPLPPVVPGCHGGMICGKAGQPCRGDADCCRWSDPVYPRQCKAGACCEPPTAECRAKTDCCNGPDSCIAVEGKKICCIPKGGSNWVGGIGMKGPEAWCCPGSVFNALSRVCE